MTFRQEFRADGIPKGQPRVRAVRRGAHAGVYDPGTADGWKAIVAAAGRPHRPPSPLSGPVRLVLWFYFPRPKRLLRKNSPPHVRHIGKPDIDNLAKAVMDALYQDGWFVDDSIVFAVNATKCYVSLSSSMPQSRPGAWIEVFAEEKP